MRRTIICCLLALGVCVSCSTAEQFTFRVLRPDGAPVENIGVRVEAASVRDQLGENPSRSSWYSGPDGTVAVDIDLPPEVDQKLLVTLVPAVPVEAVPRDTRRECVRVFREVSSRYAIDETYEFEPGDASSGNVAEIHLPDSVQVKMKPAFTRYPIASVRLYRLGGSVLQGSFPTRFDSDGAVSIPVPRARRSVLFISRDSLTKRFMLSDHHTLADLDLGEVSLDPPAVDTGVRLEATRPQQPILAVTLVAPQADLILTYVVDQRGRLTDSPDRQDPTTLPVPIGTYFVFRHYTLPAIEDDYDVPAAIERIAAGQEPGIEHAKIEVVEDEVREYRIDVAPDTGDMTATRTK